MNGEHFVHDGDAGADIYISHGAPLLHGIALHNQTPLFLGLGSLIFHSRTEIGYYPAEVWESAIVHLEYALGRLRIAGGEDARRILERLSAMCDVFGTELTIKGERGFLYPPH